MGKLTIRLGRFAASFAALIGATVASANDQIALNGNDDNTAAVSFNSSFGSYMVLQRQPAQACVYGTLGPGGTVATVKVVNTPQAVPAGGASQYEVAAQVVPFRACLLYTSPSPRDRG